MHDDALKCCDRLGNGYPHPRRMLDHIQILARAAETYHAQGGQIGRRFEDWMHDEYGLDVALFDGNQTGKKYHFDGALLDDLPHIKVDDHKHGASQCGRVHFVINTASGKILLTYLGAHR